MPTWAAKSSDVDVYARVVSLLAPFLRRHGLWECCVGGGLGVAYLNSEHAPSMAEWAAVVRTACAVARLPSEVRVTAEPGRSIVATAGITLYRVGTIKAAPGRPDVCRGRRRDERQPSARPLRQRVRGVPAP